MLIVLTFSILAAASESLSGGNITKQYEIDGVHYERAAGGDLCLMQNAIKAIAFAGQNRLIFRVDNRYYINSTQNKCRVEDVVETKITLVGKGARVCRNDRVRLKGYGRQGPPTECTLGEFFALTPVK